MKKNTKYYTWDNINTALVMFGMSPTQILRFATKLKKVKDEDLTIGTRTSKMFVWKK